MILDGYLGLTDEDISKAILIPLDFFLSSVLIPSAYILNTEKVKYMVITEGWWRPFRRFFPCYRNRVSPVEGQNMNVLPNKSRERATKHAGIQTISENIEALR